MLVIHISKCIINIVPGSAYFWTTSSVIGSEINVVANAQDFYFVFFFWVKDTTAGAHFLVWLSIDELVNLNLMLFSIFQVNFDDFLKFLRIKPGIIERKSTNYFIDESVADELITSKSIHQNIGQTSRTWKPKNRRARD